ncbi:MAG TPA: CPBP family intramembrane glutamic endopeptidase [Candidatus Dormibacteraeota bacterium]|nr:CPBP family intramembrane glutamic endopeptidase [Candidatus Dormibacteraeota bacterium]
MVTAAPAQLDAPRKDIKALLARHPLVFYFIIAYAFSWLAWMPLVLSEDGAGILSYRSPIGFYATLAIASFVGPFLSAFIMTSITEGRIGIGRLLRQLVLWPVGLRWYLFALIGLPAIMVLSVIFLPGALASFQGLAGLAPLPMLALFVYVFVLGGPLGEEPGWRGFALPRLQRLYGPLVGSLILGPIWALWHLPIFWIPAWNFPPTILNIVMFVIAATAFTIVMTWVFNNTKGSLFIAVFVHTSFDTVLSIVNGLFPVPIVNDYGSNVPVLMGLGVLALVLVALTRGRLAYQRYHEEVLDPATAPT